jgi:hypothetical protein
MGWVSSGLADDLDAAYHRAEQDPVQQLAGEVVALR